MKFNLPSFPNGARRAQGRPFLVPPIGNVDESARTSNELLDLQAVFTRVVRAYCEGSLADVRDIIARPLHDQLVGELAERKCLHHVLSSRLVEFVSAEVIDGDALLLGGWKDVRFVSRMVVALLGADGAVLAGDPVHARMFSEVWTLQRFNAGREPRWLVTAMIEDE